MVQHKASLETNAILIVERTQTAITAEAKALWQIEMRVQDLNML